MGGSVNAALVIKHSESKRISAGSQPTDLSGAKINNNNNPWLPTMPVTPTQSSAIEQVIEALKRLTSPRKKRALADLFLELVDKQTWANYYQVTYYRIHPGLLNPNPDRSFPNPAP